MGVVFEVVVTGMVLSNLDTMTEMFVFTVPVGCQDNLRV